MAASNAHHKPSSGSCALVGAGPGDPGLLTLRGAELLARAGVVVYDALANPALLDLHASPSAERVYVGKRAAHHAMSQDAINALLVERSLAGKRVVRLKGGDPFVFGRGGEECEALAAAGVPFEVVPGITAALAAPAYAGIPVTHRDLNSSFTFLTGHEKEEAYQDPAARDRGDKAAASDVDWSAVAKLPCLAFYMGVKSLPRICAKLIEHGMDAAMPAATVQWGTTPKQRTIVGTLADLPAKVAAAGLTPPALTIVGRVVALRPALNWFETRPLFGQTIVVTRTRQQASDLTHRLAMLGANVLEAPTIDLCEAGDAAAIQSTFNGSGWDWIVFTSANGVRFAKRRLFELGLDVRAFGQAAIAAVGESTAAAVRDELGLRVALCPGQAVADALADALVARQRVAGKRFLLLRADIARPVLRERLEAAGAAAVHDLPIYDTRPATSLPADVRAAFDAKKVDWITFTSSSTATGLAGLLGDGYRDRLASVKLASIGPITTAAMQLLDIPATVQASQADVASLADAIVQHVQASLHP